VGLWKTYELAKNIIELNKVRVFLGECINCASFCGTYTGCFKIVDALATLNMTFNNNTANVSVKHVLSCNFYIIYIIIFTDYSEIKL